MSYCGLSYDSGQIRMEANATPVSTASSAQVRQPIHSRNVGGWKRYAAQLEPLQEAAGRFRVLRGAARHQLKVTCTSPEKLSRSIRP